jgi:hypothetical protein
MTAIVRIHKSRCKKPNAHDYGIYTIDIDHGRFCRCCTPIHPKIEKRQYRKKQNKEAAA